MLRLPPYPLDSETRWTGELWLKTNTLNSKTKQIVFFEGGKETRKRRMVISVDLYLIFSDFGIFSSSDLRTFSGFFRIFYLSIFFLFFFSSFFFFSVLGIQFVFGTVFFQK